jgi:hypothetical protein
MLRWRDAELFEGRIVRRKIDTREVQTRYSIQCRDHRSFVTLVEKDTKVLRYKDANDIKSPN